MRCVWIWVFGIALTTAFAVGAKGIVQDTDADSEKALATGLRPLTKIEICPPVFDGNFGQDPNIPTQSELMAAVQAKLTAAGIAFTIQPRHRETFVDRTILRDRKTTGWMHIDAQVLTLSDKKAYAFRIVLQVQSPVTHPGDPKAYVFADLYQESKLTISAPDLTSDVIKNGVSEVFGRFCDRWSGAHLKK